MDKKGSKDKEVRNEQLSYRVDEDDSAIKEDDKGNPLNIDKTGSEDKEIRNEQLSYRVDKDESVIKEVDEVIFHQDIDNIVPNYTETNHLNKVSEFLSKGARLVLLTGPPGAGKTQTAYQYCSSMRGFYTIFAKFEATNDITLFNSIKVLLSELQISPKTDENENATFCSLVSSLKVYMKHSNRGNCSFLFLIDDLHVLNANIKTIIHILTYVKPLKILITTYDSTLKHVYTTASIVEHRGMDRSEYFPFFRYSDYCKNMTETEIEQIADKVGRLPLALNSARTYMETTHGDIETYIQQFDETEEEPSLDTIVSPENPFYKYGLLKSQRMPLSEIQKCISQDHWYVLMLLPLLHYQSISMEVLGACLYHKTKGKKFRASDIIEKCARFSLCHIKEDHKHSQEGTRVSDSGKNISHSFHTCTIMAMEWMNVRQRNVNSNETLLFLLKVFCYEMSLDLIDRYSLDLNLLYMPHARKLLRKLDSNEIEKSQELTFYLAYISLVVGKTFKAEETDMTLAHTYLMQARRFIFSYVKWKPAITVAHCSFLSESSSTFQSEMDAFKEISKAVVDKALVKEFILGKRRRREVIEKTTKKCKDAYIKEAELQTLFEESLALPESKLCDLFLTELLLHILLENGLCLYYLWTTPDYNSKNSPRIASVNELKSCNELCSLLKDTNSPALFPFLENETIGRSHLLLAQCSPENNPDFGQHISQLLKKIGERKQIFFDFGIAYDNLNSNRKIYSECLLRSMLLKCMLRKQMSTSTNFIRNFSDTSDCLRVAEDFLRYLDKHKELACIIIFLCSM